MKSNTTAPITATTKLPMLHSKKVRRPVSRPNKSPPEGADDADDDVLQQALLAIGAGDHAGDRAGQCPKDDQEMMPRPLSMVILHECVDAT
jgi:hypothetical protein